MSQDSSKDYVVYDLKEMYTEKGEFSFKIVLNPNVYKNSHSCEFRMKDSDGNEMKFDLKKWGRKIMCSFVIDDGVPDGVSVVQGSVQRDDGSLGGFFLRFWVIK